MALNLLDSVKAIFTSDLISRAASALGESEASISKAITGLVPSVAGAVIAQGTSGSEGAAGILNMAKITAGSGIVDELTARVPNLASSGLLSSGAGQAKRLLGDNLSNFTSAIANFAGIKQGSASALLSMIVPAVLSVLGRYAAGNNLSSTDLAGQLSAQRGAASAAIPPGLGALAHLSGLSSLGRTIPTGERGMASADIHEHRRNRWVLPVLLSVGVIGVIFLLTKGCSKESTAVATVGDTSTLSAVTVTAPMPIKVKLPDGVELDAYKDGIEHQLVAFLNSTFPGDSVSNDRWFDFDDLNFKLGSAELTDSSMRQVNNIVAILKAYPKVTIKLGGYTDKTGTDDANMKLSQQRADAVMEALKKAGASPAQIVGAEGYGSQFAKAAPDAPDAERKKDRRISISVRSK